MSISLSKWPMFPTIAWCFILLMCAAVMTSRFPVADTKMSANPTTSSIVFTSKPSIAACRAQIGSISVITTRAPWPLRDSAHPCRHLRNRRRQRPCRRSARLSHD